MLVIAEKIAKDILVEVNQVKAAIALLDEGNTVPFIARYRKEKTGGLTDSHLRQLEEKYAYLKTLEERKGVILKAISDKGMLTPALKSAIDAAENKNVLEDLYLPYKQKRKNKAQDAEESGLKSLAFALLKAEDEQSFPILASAYLNPDKNIGSSIDAIEGAKHILTAHFSEDPTVLSELRDYLWENAIISARLMEGAKDKKQQYKDYYRYEEPLKKIPSHRALALFRGRREGILLVTMTLADNDAPLQTLKSHFSLAKTTPFIETLLKRAWSIKISSKLELLLLAKLKEKAEDDSIDVFKENLKDLLLFPPAGTKSVMGIDPGIRTGIKVVVLDETGKLLDYTTLFPFAPQNDKEGTITEIAKLIIKYNSELIAIGNGTGGRETEKLIDDVLRVYKDLSSRRVMVNEAGASVYSASELAEKELPEIDVSLRGAVSIARRLQDPLAELVKIEPKAIGVGQYQHDVNQVKLSRSLGNVIEDCVNQVGVDLNTASSELLQYVAGLNSGVAKNLIKYRDEHGIFTSRESLKSVERLGDATFLQCAGFLKINNAENPLDNTSIHPEAYNLVAEIANKNNVSLKELIENKTLIQSLNADDYTTETFGLPTVIDILSALKQPGRDPRGTFKTASFKEDVDSIEDLQEDMILEGVVTNVANFGAFVDIGVHQDALVHLSELTNRFIKNPRDVVKTGDIVTVKVIEVDKERKRIGLTMKLEKSAKTAGAKNERRPNKQAAVKVKKKSPQRQKPNKVAEKKPAIFNTAMADALLKLKEK